jgi:hypothetical protein
MKANIMATLPAILFAAGSLLFLVGNVILVTRQWK